MTLFFPVVAYLTLFYIQRRDFQEFTTVLKNKEGSPCRETLFFKKISIAKKCEIVLLLSSGGNELFNREVYTLNFTIFLVKLSVCPQRVIPFGQRSGLNGSYKSTNVQKKWFSYGVLFLFRKEKRYSFVFGSPGPNGERNERSKILEN